MATHKCNNVENRELKGLEPDPGEQGAPQEGMRATKRSFDFCSLMFPFLYKKMIEDTIKLMTQN